MSSQISDVKPLETGSDIETSSAAVKFAEKTVTWGGLLAGYALLAQAIFTVVEVLARKLFNYSFQGVDEYGGYILAIITSLGFGLATLQRAHTRVDILLHTLPLKVRGCLHIFAWTVLAGVSIMMLKFSYSAFSETLQYGSIANSPLQTPLWIPQSLWVAGFVIFTISALIMVLRAYHLFFSGKFEQLDREFGTPSLTEQIESESAAN